MRLKYEQIAAMDDETLLEEYAGEIDSNTRRVSTDPPSQAAELEQEILRRMRHGS